MLPYDIETFIGRAAELEQLAEGARRVARAGRTGVFTIEGLGGIGKTALAVHAAHMITADFPELFPDAQLFLDLHGYTPGVSALAPNDALRSLLRQLGVPHALIPARQADREALYRSALAFRKSLVILDNAQDADQVRPLLPGSACCMVIVTSRDTLRSLDGATVLQLGTPPDAEAIALFRKVAGLDQADADGPALAADPRLAEIVALCAAAARGSGRCGQAEPPHRTWGLRHTRRAGGGARPPVAPAGPAPGSPGRLPVFPALAIRLNQAAGGYVLLTRPNPTPCCSSAPRCRRARRRRRSC